MPEYFIFILLALFIGGLFAFTLFSLIRDGMAISAISGWVIGIGYFICAPLEIVLLNGGFSLSDRHPIGGNYGEITFKSDDLIYALCVIAVNVLIILGIICVLGFHSRQDKKRRQPSIPNLYIDWEAFRRITYCLFAILLIEWSVSIYAYGGIESYLFSHWYTRADDAIEKIGELFLIYLRLSQSLQILLAGLGVIVVLGYFGEKNGVGLSNRQPKLSDFAYILIFAALGVIFSGNRIFIALLMIGASYSFFLAKPKIAVIFGVLGAPAVAFGASFWTVARGNYGNLDWALDYYFGKMDSLGYEISNAFFEMFEGVNMTLLFRIVEDFGGKFEFMQGASLVKSLTFVLPRSIYPDKPPPLTVILAKLYEPGAETSLIPTVLGEMFMNFGAFGILVIGAITFLLYLYSYRGRHLTSGRPILSVCIFVSAMNAVRFPVAESILMILFTVLIITIPNLDRRIALGRKGPKTIVSRKHG